MSDDTQNTGARIARGALAGLVGGIVASLAMDGLQAILARLSDADSGGESDSDAEPTTNKAADGVARLVTGDEVADANKPLAGQAMHYGLGAVLGVAYGIAAAFEPRVTTASGTLFGLTTATVLDEGAVPALGLADAPWKTPASGHLYSLASHLVFGGVTELVRAQVDATLAPAE